MAIKIKKEKEGRNIIITLQNNIGEGTGNEMPVKKCNMNLSMTGFEPRTSMTTPSSTAAVNLSYTSKCSSWKMDD